MRPHIVKLVMRAGLLKEWEVFLLVRRDRVVEHDNLDGAPVLPEVSIVLLHGFAHIAETIRGDHEIQLLRLHKVPSLFVVIRPQLLQPATRFHCNCAKTQIPPSLFQGGLEIDVRRRNPQPRPI